MATKDGFEPDARVPLFLSESAENVEHPDIGKDWDRAVIASRILKTSIAAVTATAIGIAVLSTGNPVALVANVTDWWVDKSSPQPDADPSTSTIQSIAAATQDLPPTTTDAPPRDEIAGADEPADRSQSEIGQPITEALFKQFQAWAAEEETRAQVAPAQPLQDAQAQLVQDTPAQVRPMEKDRQIRSTRNARAEVRPERKHRAKVRREHNPRSKVRREEQNAPAQVPAVADARAQEQPAQNAQLPWLLQGFGWRN